MERSDLPFGSEFSPSQIDLPSVLALANELGGDWRAFETAVRSRWFESHETSDYNRSKLANNTKLGMIAYGLIDRSARLTPLGRELLAVRDDPQCLYGVLARHILCDLHGMNVLQCVRDMESAGEAVTLGSLRVALEQRGIRFPRGGKHPSIMRLWLEKAGVVAPGGWRVDEARLRAILGASSEDFDALSALSEPQRAYLRALVALDGTGPQASNEIERLARELYGIAYHEKNLPKQVLYPLRDAGFITLERGGREVGRGAKPFQVLPAARFRSDVMEPFLRQLEGVIEAPLRDLLRRPLTEIRAEIASDDRHRAGLALEALAFKLMRLLDMTFVKTRLRGAQTGGAEVDLVFESTRLVFSRWQVQCKNTARVSLDDVAKEVGLTHLLKSNVVVVVTTGRVGTEARRFADQVMRDSQLCVVLVDGADLDAVETRPVALLDVLSREARKAMRLKALDSAAIREEAP